LGALCIHALNDVVFRAVSINNQSQGLSIHHLLACVKRCSLIAVIDDRIRSALAIVWADTTVHVPSYTLNGANNAPENIISNRSPVIALFLLAITTQAGASAALIRAQAHVRPPDHNRAAAVRPRERSSP
jgi:hypothetical protein